MLMGGLWILTGFHIFLNDCYEFHIDFPTIFIKAHSCSTDSDDFHVFSYDVHEFHCISVDCLVIVMNVH